MGEILNEHGFEHRQGSGYTSVKPITHVDALVCITNITTELNWLSDCVKKFDVTDIGETYDLTYIIHKNSNKTAASEKLPEGITNKLAGFQRDKALR